jgi:glycosyltransferase involved in cell wall biosynthesis
LKILIITNIPSPYRVDFFNELGKLCDLTVLFEKSASEERDKRWLSEEYRYFKGIIMKGITTATDKALCLEVIKYIRKDYDHVIVCNMASPTGMLAIVFMKLLRIKYIIEGDGAFPGNRSGLKGKVKKFLMKGAKGYFSTAEMHDRYYLTNGADKGLIYRYPFSSIRRKNILKELPSESQKTKLKAKYNIEEAKLIITVGQFIYRKGFDVLLKACQYINPNIGVFIVGGKPTNEYLDMVGNLKLSNIHFTDFMSKGELFEIFQCADLFVLPTREDIWGLVINEAMACGLPVITTNRCIAGLELVTEGKNGYIVPVEDENTLANKINIVLSDEKKRREMGISCLDIINTYTIESMADRHLSILKEMGK